MLDTFSLYILRVILLIVVLSVRWIVVLVVIARCRGVSLLRQAAGGVVVSMGVPVSMAVSVI